MRKRAYVYFALLILLISALLPSRATSTPIEGSSGVYTYLSMCVFYGFLLVGILILLEILLMYRDPFDRRKSDFDWKRTLEYIIIGAGIGVTTLYSLLSKGKDTPPVANNTTNITIGKALTSGGTVSSRITENATWFGYKVSSGNALGWLIIPTLFFVACMGIWFYPRLRRARRTWKIERELKSFERKMEEESGAPDEIVVESYKKAVLWLEALGVPYRDSWTHWEHAKIVQYKKNAFKELTALFEKARYAPSKVTMEEAKRAYELYKTIRGDRNESS
ncbi:DUF4129 domain-containing protein [Palaeococcus sp. (in: euryarchaeotes)]